jgi:hypothetical protein
MRRLLSTLALASLCGSVAVAQATVVDDGSFTISRAGDRVGREDFSVRHVTTTAGAFETITRGVVVLGGHRLTVDLSADSTGLPARYQLRAVDDGRASATYIAEVNGRRLSARSLRGASESAREVMLPPGALVLEDNVLHLLQFVVARGAGTVAAVVPSRGIMVSLVVQDVGADRVSIALQSLDARKFIVREGPGGTVREVWTDAAGRLLKVAIPSDRLIAVRDDAPRSPAR